MTNQPTIPLKCDLEGNQSLGKTSKIDKVCSKGCLYMALLPWCLQEVWDYLVLRQAYSEIARINSYIRNHLLQAYCRVPGKLLLWWSWNGGSGIMQKWRGRTQRGRGTHIPIATYKIGPLACLKYLKLRKFQMFSQITKTRGSRTLYYCCTV